MNIRTSINVACAYADINQKELSARTGISTQTLSKLSKKDANCSLGTMKLIAIACGFKVSEFAAFGEE